MVVYLLINYSNMAETLQKEYKLGSIPIYIHQFIENYILETQTFNRHEIINVVYKKFPNFIMDIYYNFLDIRKYMSSFSSGGTLYFGVDDNGDNYGFPILQNSAAFYENEIKNSFRNLNFNFINLLTMEEVYMKDNYINDIQVSIVENTNKIKNQYSIIKYNDLTKKYYEKQILLRIEYMKKVEEYDRKLKSVKENDMEKFINDNYNDVLSYLQQYEGIDTVDIKKICRSCIRRLLNLIQSMDIAHCEEIIKNMNATNLEEYIFHNEMLVVFRKIVNVIEDCNDVQQIINIVRVNLQNIVNKTTKNILNLDNLCAKLERSPCFKKIIYTKYEGRKKICSDYYFDILVNNYFVNLLKEKGTLYEAFVKLYAKKNDILELDFPTPLRILRNVGRTKRAIKRGYHSKKRYPITPYFFFDETISKYIIAIKFPDYTMGKNIALCYDGLYYERNIGEKGPYSVPKYL